MTSSKNRRNRNIKPERRQCFQRLASALSKRGVFKIGLFASLALATLASAPDAVQAQQSFGAQRVQVVANPWTNANGRSNYRQTQSQRQTLERRNPIRQTQALSAPQQDELFEDPLSVNPSFNTPLEDPMQIAEPILNSAPLGESTAQNAAEQIPSAVETVASPITDAQRNAVSNLKTADSNAQRTIQDYPQGDLLNQGRSDASATAGNGAYSNALPRATNNPYSRIGQAEYHPNQFYGAGGNYSVNGYRNTPPAVAYGQSLCGEPCYNGGCGVFGGFFQNTQLEAGFVGMRSPRDLYDSGNFGGDFAINWGSVQPVLGGLHIQAGVRSVFTDLNGTSGSNRMINGFPAREDCRSQFFWTAGLYYRSSECGDGLSLGFVYDSLHDDYYRKVDLRQIRAELSYSFMGCGALGFRGAFRLNKDKVELFGPIANLTSIAEEASASNYYTMFYRRQFEQGGEATVFGGVTEWSEGLVGVKAEAPLTESFALKLAGTYVFARERHDNPDSIRYHLTKREEEAWNMSMGVVWYLGGGARNTVGSQRPLFDVADNGSFLQNF